MASLDWKRGLEQARREEVRRVDYQGISKPLWQKLKLLDWRKESEKANFQTKLTEKLLRIQTFWTGISTNMMLYRQANIIPHY